MMSLEKIEEALERDTEGLDRSGLSRPRLLDLALVLSLAAHGLERSIERYSAWIGSENDAAEALKLLGRVKASTLWLRAYRDVAAEEELCRRVVTGRRDALRTVLVVRRMQYHHYKVSEQLRRFLSTLDAEPGY